MGRIPSLTRPVRSCLLHAQPILIHDLAHSSICPRDVRTSRTCTHQRLIVFVLDTYIPLLHQMYGHLYQIDVSYVRLRPQVRCTQSCSPGVLLTKEVYRS